MSATKTSTATLILHKNKCVCVSVSVCLCVCLEFPLYSSPKLYHVSVAVFHSNVNIHDAVVCVFGVVLNWGQLFYCLKDIFFPGLHRL